LVFDSFSFSLRDAGGATGVITGYGSSSQGQQPSGHGRFPTTVPSVVVESLFVIEFAAPSDFSSRPSQSPPV